MHLSSNRRFASRFPLGSALLVFAGLSAGACQDQTASSITSQEDALLFHAQDVVLDWNEHALAAIHEHDGQGDPLLTGRALSMVHVAMHDAVSSTGYRFYEPYASAKRDLLAHPVAAAASAAARMLVRLFPAQQAALEEKLQTSLLAVRDGKAEQRGVLLGQRVADGVFELRVDDGSSVVEPYTPGDQPGDYQFTTPDFIYRAGWQNVTPWGLARADQFRPEPPPTLDSAEYTLAYEEVRTKGDQQSTLRSADESEYAQFWYEFSELGWNRVARIAAEHENLGLAQTARLFALVHMAMADSYIAGWDAKFFYDSWRPVTAIHAGDSDGNPATAADLSFESFLPTPPVQDYPSTHSTLGAAAAEVLTRFFGRHGERFAFSMTSPSASEPEQPRKFANFRAAARENADSRVMAGIHFRFATDAGLTLGAAIGAHIYEQQLQRAF